MTDNGIGPLEAAQRDCEAAEQHVSDCRDALERAERAAAAAREKLKALSAGKEVAAVPKAPPPEVAEVPKAPPPTSGMKGIFTRAPLPETKAERREAQEIAELRSMEEPPCWSSETLLCELRACAASSGAPSCTLVTAPLDWGGLARARQAGRLCASNVGVDGAPMLAAETEEGLSRLGVVHVTTLSYTPEQNAKCWELGDAPSGGDRTTAGSVTGHFLKLLFTHVFFFDVK